VLGLFVDARLGKAIEQVIAEMEFMTVINQLHQKLVDALAEAGKDTPYLADANEPDVRYKGYGVRAPAMKALIREYAPILSSLTGSEQRELAKKLIASGYGEQKTIGLHLLALQADYFSPDKFSELEGLVRQLQGWSKIDTLCGGLLKLILQLQKEPLIDLLTQWNQDEDLWLRRASVVVFTRKVAASGRYTDVALKLCDNLKHDAEDMVRKGVGWCLKDLMRADRARVINYVIELREQRVSSVITLYALRDIKGKERARLLQAR